MVALVAWPCAWWKNACTVHIGGFALLVGS